MNFILIRRTLRDYFPLAVGATVLLFVFAVLFVFATNSIPLEEGRQWLKLEWVRRLVNAMVGGDLAEALTPTGVSSFIFTHPLTWVLVVGFVFTISTGVLSAEMDRGTMDLLATLPVSRATLYSSVSVVVLILGVPLMIAPWLGVWVGARIVGVIHLAQMGRLAVVAVNLYAAYILISGLSICLSAVFERRTSALIACFVIVFYSAVLNLLVAFWPAAQKIAFTGFFYYFAPLRVVLNSTFPAGDISVLCCAGLLFWLTGLVCFCRRDIHVT
ncbi:MAG: hypothetical protein KF841_11945 [Phycisphaerae bacterium]|nr:hypothetical protein [Phycisphaerae bacterium]